MEKEQFEELMAQLKKFNENLARIAGELHHMNDTLDLIKEEVKPRASFKI